MKRSIFLKVFGGYFLIIIILTGIIFTLSFNVIRNFYLDMLSHNLENLGHTLKLKVINFLSENRYEELDSFVKEFGENIKTRITIVNNEGVVLADSDEDPEIMGNHKFRPEIYRALGGHTGESLRFSKTVKEEMLYVGIPVEREGEITAVLRVSLYVKDINQLLSSLKINMGRIVLIMTLLSLIGAFLFSRSLSNPIREMSDASRRIASGDFDAKVLLKTRGELKELADSFNYMTEQIKSLFAELSRQKDELNSILSSIEEGLLVLDKEGKILLSNRSFKKIVQSDLPEEKYYWEVLREPQFSEVIKKIQNEKKSLSTELELNGKNFFCNAAFLASREEIVITLHDLTKAKNVEKIKKDFIVNVSHELRTPLTAIKGFVETLEEEVDERNQKYLKIIKRHTDRLINIVKDLLLLSKLEEKESRLEVEKVNIKVLIGNILKIFEQNIKEKKLDVELKIEDDLPPVKGDPFKLEQMFINIIDNAVKYTEKGKITITVEKIDKKISIKIRDTGIGIPEEHLPRVFERFYVVDKSRSKKLGGTGLGLSIVKHITFLHDGEVNVKSESGKGTTFNVILPFELSMSNI